MDVDVLVSGGTGKFGSWEAGGRFFVDPGSATGAWDGGLLGCAFLLFPFWASLSVQSDQRPLSRFTRCTERRPYQVSR